MLRLANWGCLHNMFAYIKCSMRLAVEGVCIDTVHIYSVLKPVLAGDEVEAKVNRILRNCNSRGCGGGDENLVLLKIFKISEATCEKASNLVNA